MFLKAKGKSENYSALYPTTQKKVKFCKIRTYYSQGWDTMWNNCPYLTQQKWKGITRCIPIQGIHFFLSLRTQTKIKMHSRNKAWG